MRILAIESSCDDTGVAIFDGTHGLLANQIYRQIDMHTLYGGVVPELASRDHVIKIIPLIQKTLEEANLTIAQVDGIAYTKGPGLIGALMVGAMTARSLAYALNKPCIGIHHLEGHLLAPMLESNPPTFPHLALLVSGGHTQLIQVAKIGDYKILGETLDDAAGEAFDKVAKLLGLPYPGGPQIAALALKGQDRFTFPRPLTTKPGLDFSFSGLKTAVANTAAKHTLDLQTKSDIAKAFEDAVVDTFIIKCKRALEETQLTTLVISGGVSANQKLREQLQILCDKQKIKLFYPRLEFCSDNAAMIAYCGWVRLSQGQKDLDLSVTPLARWPLSDLKI